MFQMLFRILAFSECVRNINCSPLPNVNSTDSSPLPNVNNTDSSPLPEKNWIEKIEEQLQSNPETVEELASIEGTVVEGDELMMNDRNAVDNIWTEEDAEGDISVPYVISPELISDGRTDDIEAAMAMISDVTCVSFHERTEEPDYLHFQKKGGCASYVGRIGGVQALYVGPYCHKGNICHEILHALGFHHEQTRPDHDKYIKIIYKNITPGKERNFKVIHADYMHTEYDKGSILHYGGYYFSFNGKPTIELVDETDECEIGQRRSLSQLDIEKVNKLYKCDDKDGDDKDEVASTLVPVTSNQP